MKNNNLLFKATIGYIKKIVITIEYISNLYFIPGLNILVFLICTVYIKQSLKRCKPTGI